MHGVNLYDFLARWQDKKVQLMTQKNVQMKLKIKFFMNLKTDSNYEAFRFIINNSAIYSYSK